MDFRKVRPIYDALDARNYKQALKLSTNALEKNPKDLLVKSLKAYALERQGKKSEASALCDELKAAVPTDESVLSTVSIVLRSLGRGKEYVTLMEAAVEKLPTDEGLLTTLFCVLASDGQAAKAQQAAMKLFRTFNKPDAMFWTVLCLVMQAEASKPMMVELAVRMLDKMADEGKLKHFEQLWLYLDVLRRNRAHARAFAVVAGPLGALCPMPAERLRLALEHAEAAQQQADVAAVSRAILSKYNPDDWLVAEKYIAAVRGFAGVASGAAAAAGAPSAEPTAACAQLLSSLGVTCVVDVTIDAARELFLQLQAAEEAVTLARRGPFLGELALMTDVHARVPQLVAYARRFGARPCCADDLLPYVRPLPADAVRAIAAAAAEVPETAAAASAEHAMKHKQTQVLRRVTELKLLRIGGVMESSLDSARQLLAAYTDSLVIGETLQSTERRSGDDLALVCAHVLLDLLSQTGDKRYLIDALVLLEHAQERSPKNFQFTLLLVRGYAMLGAWQPAGAAWGSLGIKHIQLDTMTLYALQPALRALAVEDAQSMCQETVDFHTDYASRDAGDYLANAFRNGSYSQVLEFILLSSKLATSQTLAACRTELALLAAMRHPTTAAAALPDALPSGLCNNTDVPELRWDASDEAAAAWMRASLIGPFTAASSPAALQLRHAAATAVCAVQRGDVAVNLAAVYENARKAWDDMRDLATGDTLSEALSEGLLLLCDSLSSTSTACATAGDPTSHAPSAAASAVAALSDLSGRITDLAVQRLSVSPPAATLLESPLCTGALSAASVAMELLGLCAAVAAPLCKLLPKKAAKKKGKTEDADPLDALRTAVRAMYEQLPARAKALSAALAAHKKRPVLPTGEPSLPQLAEGAFAKDGAGAVAAKVSAAHQFAVSRAQIVVDAAAAAATAALKA